MTTKSKWFPAIICACCLAFPVSALQPLAAQKQHAALRVTTRLVEVNVVAQDKKGAAITDLTRSDFEVSEQGKPRALSAFLIESNRNAVGRNEALPANTFSNMPSQAGASRNFTAILFDALNTPMQDQAHAKSEVMRFLQQIKSQERVAIYGLAASLQVIHDFTGNAEALVRAIDHYRVQSSMEQTASTAAIEDNTWLAENVQEASIIGAMDAFLNSTNGLIARYYIEQRTTITLRALEAIANH